ncbi:MAG: methyltransferase domain-containing protein [Planctomycetota bacterium]
MLRQRVSEIMDDPRVDPIAHAQALRALNRVNGLLGVDRCLKRTLTRFGDEGLSILDLGCGGGGFLANLRRGHENHWRNTLVGLDRSEQALKSARDWHSGTIHWVSGDACRIPLANESVDVVTCSLFLHHFDEADGTRILQEAARIAKRGIVIGDLLRSRLAWVVTWLMTRVLSRSRIFHVDGPRSVRAAFRKDELANLARDAGLNGATVKKSFPFRLVLTWVKDANPIKP